MTEMSETEIPETVEMPAVLLDAINVKTIYGFHIAFGINGQGFAYWRDWFDKQRKECPEAEAISVSIQIGTQSRQFSFEEFAERLGMDPNID
jgi:hypothetical protein